MTAQSEPLDSNSAWRDGWPQSQDEFERLVEVYLDRLVRYAFRFVGNLQDAEDVVQDVFGRAYADRAKRAEVAHPGAYLYRMTRNSCINLLRRRKIPCQSLDAIHIETIRANTPGPSDQARAAEALLRAESLVGQLPKEQAEAVRLRVFDELSLNEIAEIVGCSVNTVASRLRYGFQKLRKIVSRQRRFES